MAIADLAPTLVSAGLTPKEIRKELRPRQAAPARQQPGIPNKRIIMAYRMILKNKDDATIMRLACVSQEVINGLRAEVAAVKASLAALAPVAYDAEEPPQENQGQ